LIRIDAIWMAVEPLDMRAGIDTALARVVSVFGDARMHHAYLFANRRANRVKVLVHDGFGIWLCARRLHQGRFVWATDDSGQKVSMTVEQLNALVIGLPWRQLGDLARIRMI
jgi:transposase